MEEKIVSQDTRSESISTGEAFGVFIKMNALMHSLSSMISSESKIPLSDLVAIEHLRIDGSLTAKEVAHRVQMGSGATTAMLDRLEKRGLVRRTPHPTDRRSVVVSYVGHGGPAEPGLIKFLELLEARIEALSPEERPVVAAFLQGVSDDVEEALRKPKRNAQTPREDAP